MLGRSRIITEIDLNEGEFAALVRGDFLDQLAACESAQDEAAVCKRWIDMYYPNVKVPFQKGARRVQSHDLRQPHGESQHAALHAATG
ncbi:MAG: hypothetical protein OHK0046_47420 [Anaerolineae bacterium]